MYKAKANFTTEEGSFKIGDEYKGDHEESLLKSGLIEKAVALSPESLSDEDMELEQEEEDFGEEKAVKKKKKGK